MVQYNTERSQHNQEEELVGKRMEENSLDWKYTLKSLRKENKSKCSDVVDIIIYEK